MNEPVQTIPHESRWPPALAILVVILSWQRYPATSLCCRFGFPTWPRARRSSNHGCRRAH